MSPSPKPISYRQLTRFFVPLALVPLMIASTHTVMDTALARLPAPEISLAVFAIVKNLTNAVKAPGLISLQTTASLIDDRNSFRMVMRFLWILCAVLIGLLLIISLTPAGEWLLRHVIGLRDPDQIALAYAGLRVAAFMPIVEVLRNSVQGIAISLARTRIMAISTILRVVGVAVFLWWVVVTQAVSGVVAASFAWVIGIGFEAVLIVVYLIRSFGSVGAAAERIPERDHGRLQLLGIATFFAPLAVMMTLNSWLLPLIQSGLARSVSPTEALAAYGVTWGLVMLITGPVQVLHQSSLVYVRRVDDHNWPIVRRFCYVVGLLGAGVILLLALTPAGEWVLRDLMAVPASVVALALPALGAFAPFPIIRAWREAYWGTLMRDRTTTIIGGAKVANILAVAALLVLAFGVFNAGYVIPSTVVGALAYVCGEAVESIVIWWHAQRRHEPAPVPA